MTGSRLVLGFAGAVLMYRFGVPFYPEESRAGSSFLLLDEPDEGESGAYAERAA